MWRAYLVHGNIGLGVIDAPTWQGVMDRLPVVWREVFYGTGHPSREELDAIDSTP
jgi:hypothetical protein